MRRAVPQRIHDGAHGKPMRHASMNGVLVEVFVFDGFVDQVS